MFLCNECGRKFKTVKSAERAVSNGCPKCSGSDIDVDYGIYTATFGLLQSTPRKTEPTRDTLHPEGF